MKNLIFLSIVFLFFTACNSKDENSKLIDDSSTPNSVYVCTGPSSKAYHNSKGCDGLRNCSKEIKSVSIEEAKNMKRRPCGYCYK